MNKIEELYEFLEIGKIRECETYDDCPCALSHPCNMCDVSYKEIYPPFTERKIFKIIKLFKDDCFVISNSGRGYSCSLTPNTQKGRKSVLSGTWEQGLEHAFASFILKLYPTLSNEDKECVKNILS